MEMLTLPGTLDSLEPIGKYIMDAAADAGIEKRRTYRLRQAVDEIATNSVIHGYDEAGLTGLLRLYAEVDDSNLKIIFEDEGYPFDPRQLSHPYHKDLPVEERPIGGLGVYLTLKNVDEFHYEHDGQWNRHIFILYRK